MSRLPAPKSDFIALAQTAAYLATGGQPPMLTRHRDAFERFAADKANGTAGYEAHWRTGDRTKSLLSSLTGLPPGDHALLGSASEGIARVISSMDWQPGDNVVVADRDLEASLEYLLRFGIDAIETHVQALASALLEGITGLGLEVITPAASNERAGNVAFADARDEDTVREAAESAVYLWDGGGRVRASVHLFNTTHDVQRCLDWLAQRSSRGR